MGGCNANEAATVERERLRVRCIGLQLVLRSARIARANPAGQWKWGEVRILGPQFVSRNAKQNAETVPTLRILALPFTRPRLLPIPRGSAGGGART
jgi:hypothetical protein